MKNFVPLCFFSFRIIDYFEEGFGMKNEQGAVSSMANSATSCASSRADDEILHRNIIESVFLQATCAIRVLRCAQLRACATSTRSASEVHHGIQRSSLPKRASTPAHVRKIVFRHALAGFASSRWEERFLCEWKLRSRLENARAL